MSWPNWMEDEVLRWLITGIGISILGIIVTVVLKFWPTHPSKKQLPTLFFDIINNKKIILKGEELPDKQMKTEVTDFIKIQNIKPRCSNK